MVRTLVFAALASFVFAEDAPQVEAIGARVVKSSELKEHMLWPTGTSALLQVISKNSEFTRLDVLSSKLSKVVDDRGNNLLPEIKGAVAFGEVIGVNPRFQISADRKVCVFEAATPQVPAAGAKTVTFGGTLLMECASKRVETVLTNMPLQNGVKLAGPNKMSLSIERVGEPEANKKGNPAVEFLLRSERDLTDLDEIKFFKLDGSEYKAKRMGTSALKIEGATKVEWTYVISEKAEAATVKLYTWADATKKKIDFEVKVNLGL